MTVTDFLLGRLKTIGIDHLFGIPGDYILSFFEALDASDIQHVAPCNELNGGYAADGYARLRGAGAIAVTYGPGAFSLVNAVEPGTFELGSMDRLATPAVSLFMRAHELDDPVDVFDQMLEVAQGLADELGGEVKDDSHSVLTPQTIEHCREEIRNYRHRYL